MGQIYAIGINVSNTIMAIGWCRTFWVEHMLKSVEQLKKFVGSRVRDLRKRAGFASAEALAEAIGMHSASVYELERGDNWISPEMVIKLCNIFGVEPASFFIPDSIPIQNAIAAISKDTIVQLRKEVEEIAKISGLEVGGELKELFLTIAKKGMEIGIGVTIEHFRKHPFSIETKTSEDEAIAIAFELVKKLERLSPAKRGALDLLAALDESQVSGALESIRLISGAPVNNPDKRKKS